MSVDRVRVPGLALSNANFSASDNTIPISNSVIATSSNNVVSGLHHQGAAIYRDPSNITGVSSNNQQAPSGVGGAAGGGVGGAGAAAVMAATALPRPAPPRRFNVVPCSASSHYVKVLEIADDTSPTAVALAELVLEKLQQVQTEYSMATSETLPVPFLRDIAPTNAAIRAAADGMMTTIAGQASQHGAKMTLAQLQAAAASVGPSGGVIGDCSHVTTADAALPIYATKIAASFDAQEEQETPNNHPRDVVRAAVASPSYSSPAVASGVFASGTDHQQPHQHQSSSLVVSDSSTTVPGCGDNNNNNSADDDNNSDNDGGMIQPSLPPPRPVRLSMTHLPEKSSYENSLVFAARCGLPPALSHAAMCGGASTSAGSGAASRTGASTPTIRSGAATARSAVGRGTPRVFGATPRPVPGVSSSSYGAGAGGGVGVSGAGPNNSNIGSTPPTLAGQDGTSKAPSPSAGGGGGVSFPQQQQQQQQPQQQLPSPLLIHFAAGNSASIADAELLVSLIVGSVTRTIASFHKAGLVHGGITASNVFAKWVSSFSQSSGGGGTGQHQHSGAIGQQHQISSAAPSPTSGTNLSPSNSQYFADSQQPHPLQKNQLGNNSFGYDAPSLLTRIDRGDKLEVCITDIGFHMLSAAVPAPTSAVEGSSNNNNIAAAAVGRNASTGSFSASAEDTDVMSSSYGRYPTPGAANTAAAAAAVREMIQIHFAQRCYDRPPPPELAAEIAKRIVDKSSNSNSGLAAADGLAATNNNSSNNVNIPPAGLVGNAAGYRWIEVRGPEDVDVTPVSNHNSNTGNSNLPLLAPPTFAHDVWNIGILAIELLLGAAPLVPESIVRRASNIISSPRQRQLNNNNNASSLLLYTAPVVSSHFSMAFRSFIAAACDVDPTRRRTAEQLLAHPFLRCEFLRVRQDSPSQQQNVIASYQQQQYSYFAGGGASFALNVPSASSSSALSPMAGGGGSFGTPMYHLGSAPAGFGGGSQPSVAQFGRGGVGGGGAALSSSAMMPSLRAVIGSTALPIFLTAIHRIRGLVSEYLVIATDSGGMRSRLVRAEAALQALGLALVSVERACNGTSSSSSSSNSNNAKQQQQPPRAVACNSSIISFADNWMRSLAHIVDGILRSSIVASNAAAAASTPSASNQQRGIKPTGYPAATVSAVQKSSWAVLRPTINSNSQSGGAGGGGPWSAPPLSGRCFDWQNRAGLNIAELRDYDYAKWRSAAQWTLERTAPLVAPSVSTLPGWF